MLHPFFVVLALVVLAIVWTLLRAYARLSDAREPARVWIAWGVLLVLTAWNGLFLFYALLREAMSGQPENSTWYALLVGLCGGAASFICGDRGRLPLLLAMIFGAAVITVGLVVTAPYYAADLHPGSAVNLAGLVLAAALLVSAKTRRSSGSD